MNIYIAVEIKYREFLSRLLLGAASALNGNDVFLGDDEIFKLIEKKIKSRNNFIKKYNSNKKKDVTIRKL